MKPNMQQVKQIIKKHNHQLFLQKQNKNKKDYTFYVKITRL